MRENYIEKKNAPRKFRENYDKVTVEFQNEFRSSGHGEMAQGDGGQGESVQTERVQTDRVKPMEKMTRAMMARPRRQCRPRPRS